LVFNDNIRIKKNSQSIKTKTFPYRNQALNRLVKSVF